MECSAEVGAGGTGNDHAFESEVEGDHQNDGAQDSWVWETPRHAGGTDLVSDLLSSYSTLTDGDESQGGRCDTLLDDIIHSPTRWEPLV